MDFLAIFFADLMSFSEKYIKNPVARKLVILLSLIGITLAVIVLIIVLIQSIKDVTI